MHHLRIRTHQHARARRGLDHGCLSLSVAPLLEMTGRINRVRLLFYLLVKAALAIHDLVTSARLVSVAAMTGTVLLLALLGRTLGAPGVGVAAAVVLVVMPLASRWAQDARPAALVTLAATAAGWRLTAAARPSARRAQWVAYGACVVMLGVTNVLGLLLLPAHGVYLALTRPWHLQRRWLAATAAGLALLVPWLLLTVSQRDQVAWIEAPHLYDLTGLFIHAFGSRPAVVAVFLGTVLTIAICRGLPGGCAGDLFVLGAAWAVIPPGLLWMVSFAWPLWDLHYVIFALPGLALLVAAQTAVLTVAMTRRLRRPSHSLGRPAVAALGRPAVAGAVAAILAMVGAPDQLAYRDPATGHDGEDTTAVAAYLRQHAKPGDGILFSPLALQDLEATFPQDFSGLEALGLARAPVQSGTLHGERVLPEELPGRLAGRDRIWLLTRDVSGYVRQIDIATIQAVHQGRRATFDEHVPGFLIQLYQPDARPPAGCPTGTRYRGFSPSGRPSASTSRRSSKEPTGTAPRWRAPACRSTFWVTWPASRSANRSARLP